MQPTVKTARIAGLLYLLSAVTAGLPLIYVSSSLIVPGDPAATASHILASQLLFRAAIASELAGALILLFTVRALHRLLSGVNETQASLMVTLVLISVPISFFNVLYELVALTLLKNTAFMSPFDHFQREAFAMLLLTWHEYGVSLANIFWGMWLLPFGALVIKSRFIPRILGVLLILNGCALVIVSMTGLFLPAYLEVVNRFAIFPELGELWMMAWLLIKGVRVLPALAS